MRVEIVRGPQLTCLDREPLEVVDDSDSSTQETDCH